MSAWIIVDTNLGEGRGRPLTPVSLGFEIPARKDYVI